MKKSQINKSVKKISKKSAELEKEFRKEDARLAKYLKNINPKDFDKEDDSL